jgi:hypothetical protein
MTLHLPHLPQARALMHQELIRDLTSTGIYQSTSLTPQGLRLWPALLEEAILHHDDAWLTDQLHRQDLLATFTPSGKRVSSDAAERLAEDQFNRYYLRGLCLLAQTQNISHVQIYRAKQVQNPRPDSEAILGQLRPVGLLLDALRAGFVNDALGLRPGPNSGLSARFT